MSKLMDRLQPAVKTETKNAMASTAVGVVLMIIVFAVLHFGISDRIPFDYTVVLGGVLGGLVAVANFFLMALMVQNVASTENEDMARQKVKASIRQRQAMQIIWMVLAIVIPKIDWIAGILPLLFPSMAIRLKGILPLLFARYGKK